MEEIVLMSDPRVAAIPAQECGERLVDVRSDGSLLVDPRKEEADGAFAGLRAGVLERLLLGRVVKVASSAPWGGARGVWGVQSQGGESSS